MQVTGPKDERDLGRAERDLGMSLVQPPAMCAIILRVVLASFST